MLRILAALLLLFPAAAQATPTRALTLDGQQMLIADDYDATVYYHLAPNFKDHLYLDVLNNGKSLGWAFLDVKYGTLVLWWNKESGAKPLYDGLAANNSFFYQARDLNANTGNAHAPLEGWVREPDVKVSAGYALELTDRINLGLCAQWATLDQNRDFSLTDGSSAPLVAGAPASLSRYLSTSYASNLQVTAYRNRQAASSLATAVSLGINAERYALDVKAETIANTINNSHQEEVRDLGGTMMGTVTQGLKDKGAPSWLSMGKLRIPMGDSALVLRGGTFNYDFSTQHTQRGSFSGTGFANSDELAGFDHVDAEQAYTVKAWDAMLGWTRAIANSKGMVVAGIGLNSGHTRQEDVYYAPKTGGPTVRYNDLVRVSRTETVSETFAVPLVLGAELELSKFAKCSGSVLHNVLGSSSTRITADNHDASTGALAARAESKRSTDLNPGWRLGTGLGLYFGAFSWDLAVNSSFFASSGGWVNPAYQSSLAWGF